jgi:CubicO group peptidase (beta-lactamase class C family)
VAKLRSVFALAALAVAAAASAAPGAVPQAQIDKLFEAFDKPDSPGCSLAVIQDGSIAYARGYGMANLEHGIPNGPRTVFDIGSTSKQFTTASVLLLAQQGKLALDDDVRKHIPELPDYGKTITIRHLIHHTSGLRDYLELMEFAGWRFEDVSTDRDAFELIARQKALNYPPGDEHLYSNSGYFLLSLVVKHASGKALSRFAHESLFAPLGMKDTHYHDDHTQIVPRRATGYAPAEVGGFAIDMSNFEQTGDGAVYTTVEDLLLWDRNFYDPTVGGRELVEQMVRPGVLNSGKVLDYAFGLSVGDYRGLRLVSHGGSWAGYRAELLRVPERRFSVACLCNLASASPGRLARRVADVWLADQFPKAREDAAAEPAPDTKAVRAAPPADELARYTGLYRDPKTGSLRRYSVKDGKLVTRAWGLSFELSPAAPGVFRAQQPYALEVVFEPPQGGPPRRARETVEGDDEPSLREAIEPPRLAESQLAEYAGSYDSDELLTSYTLAVSDGQLVLRAKNQGPGPLEPTVRDEFNVDGVVFRFDRAEGGTVSGFRLSRGRVRDIWFEKTGR